MFKKIGGSESNCRQLPSSALNCRQLPSSAINCRQLPNFGSRQFNCQKTAAGTLWVGDERCKMGDWRSEIRDCQMEDGRRKMREEG